MNLQKENRMINVMQPSLGKEELERIKEVFESNWIGKGQLVRDFEVEYAKHLDSTPNRVISTNCCSEGLFSSMISRRTSLATIVSRMSLTMSMVILWSCSSSYSLASNSSII